MKWPNLQDVYDSDRSFLWRDEFMHRFRCGWNIRHFITEMSSKFCRKDEVSNCDLVFFDSMMQNHEYAYYFIVNELMSIANDDDPAGNLTEKFYTEKVIRYVRQVHLSKKWQHFLSLPSEELVLEKGAVLVAQWSQPLTEVKYKKIAKQLDDIASAVKTELRKKHSNHPLFRVPPEKLSEWRNKNINDNQWKPSESHQILDALRNVLFTQMGFHGNNEMYYNVESSFLNKVIELRCGIPITLSIVYESIARRLGVKCEPVNFPAHFLLRWQEKYKSEEERSTYYYIDVYNCGHFLTKRDCPHYSPNSQCPMREIKLQPETFVKVVERLANNLEVAGRQRAQGREARLRSTLELMHLVNPADMNCVFHLARFYMLHHMNLGDLVAALKKTQDYLGPREREQAAHIIKMMRVYESHHYSKESESLPDIEPRLRAPGVEYAIGMIMRHLRYDYTCVIYGWDPFCNASQEWIYQMGVDNLPCKDRQPFYNVLVEDGSTRYVAQENLEVAVNPIKINHVDVGRFFKRFCGTHYVPNTEKEEEYPQDADVRVRFLMLPREL
ncbi:F-box only protein 21 [Gryllus bimaculatus]|nr:F-box only protein 21 [Gryllus bimaculatus]